MSISAAFARSGCAPTPLAIARGRSVARHAFPHDRFRLSRAAEESCALRRDVERFPYVPADPAMLDDNCYEAYNIQVQGLAQRLKATGLKKLVIGVSGGLDSTQALIVSARAMDRLGLPRTDILAYTLPGFATGERDQGQCLAADEGARRQRRRDRHPPGGAADAARYRPCRGQGRGLLRRDLRECPGRAAHRLSVSAGEP